MKTQLTRSFNQAAHTYDDYCAPQTMIGSHLIQLIQQHRVTPTAMIDLGCGTGIITEQLITTFSNATCDAIDIADYLLQKCRARLVNTHANVFHADFDRTITQHTQYDLIFSNMALHWSEDLQQTLKITLQYLKPGGLIAFSIPLPGTLHELTPHFSINIFPEYTWILELLAKYACELIDSHTETLTFSFDSTRSALHSIKAVGANTTATTKPRHLNGKNFLNNISIQHLTYHIGYFLARAY